MIAAISVLLLIFASLYFVFLARIRHGLMRTMARVPIAFTPTVSILIAARNEEQHIEECVRSILSQEYPPELIEIVIVDDSSSDSTKTRVAALARETGRIRLITDHAHLAGRGEGKPQALTIGLSQAKNEIVLVTDADCTVSPRWVRSVVSEFTDTTTMVMGPVVESRQRSFFSALQGLEAFGIVVVTAGLVGIRKPLICIGANFAFRRSTFYDVDGFGRDHEPWVESIMQRIDRTRSGGVRFAMHPDAIVFTMAPKSLDEFFWRRIRWGAVKPHYQQPWSLLKLASIYIFFLIVLAATLLAFAYPGLRPLVASIWFFKLLFEYQTLAIGAAMLRQKITFGHFIIAEVLHVPYIVIVGALAQLVPVRWKGRIIRR